MQKLVSAAGLSAPLLYFCIVLIGGSITPGYDHLALPVSALFAAGALYATPISIGFVAYNLLLLFFGLGLFLGKWRKPWQLRLAAAMVLLNGLFGIVIELAPMDAQGTTVTATGIVHMVLAGLLVVTCMAAMGLAALGWHAEKRSPAFTRSTLVLLAIMFVSGAIAAIAAAQNWPLMGVYQRLTIGAYLIWIGAIALKPQSPRL